MRGSLARPGRGSSSGDARQDRPRASPVETEPARAGDSSRAEISPDRLVPRSGGLWIVRPPTWARRAAPSAQTGAISSVVGLQASLQEAAGKTTQIIAPGKHMPARVALPNFGLADGRHIGLIPVPAQLAGQTPALPQVAGADGKQPQEETLRGAIGSAMAQHAAEAIHSIDKGIAASLGPRSESLAFSLRLVETVAAGKRVQAAAQAEAPRGQSHNDSKNEEQTPAAATDATSTIRGEPLTNASGDVAARATSTSSNEPVMLPQVEIRPEVAMTQQRETSHTSAPAAIHEIQPITPEVPRVPATSEILLQLGSKEQPASIRVSDRGGAVNVTVHAADPDLRSSLRSNLGDLASQLSHQGWKAEVVKSGTVLTRTETPQDPGHDGQRSSGQQHSFTQGERQQSRDRRTNSNEWLSEFEEQTSGNAGGGK